MFLALRDCHRTMTRVMVQGAFSRSEDHEQLYPKRTNNLPTP